MLLSFRGLGGGGSALLGRDLLAGLRIALLQAELRSRWDARILRDGLRGALGPLGLHKVEPHCPAGSPALSGTECVFEACG